MSEENERAMVYVKEHIESIRDYLLEINVHARSYEPAAFNIMTKSKREELDILLHIFRSVQAINAVGDIMDIFNRQLLNTALPKETPKDKSNVVSLVKE